MHIAQVALLFECAAGGDSSIAVAAGDAAADNGDTALFDLVESGGDDNTS